MARTVGIRLRQAGKIFYYDAAGFDDLPVSTYVVVETSHGLAVGRVVIAPDQVIANESSNQDELKPILRLATEEDVEHMEQAQSAANDAVLKAKEYVSGAGIDMSIASGEFDLEQTQFTAYFTATERVDFRNLVRDLSRDMGVRVQLLQVGDRDRAKLVDGFDICGERLCCSSWMTNFPSVSIRMAKEQDLPLNPQKISGVCGRLYCCLTFEYEEYKALRGTLPKVGSFISTPVGQAKVIGIDFNREVVRLYLTERGEVAEVAAIDFQLQHGVTLRPMELVHKVEGEMRPITEDTRPAEQQRPPRRERGPREGQGQPQQQRGPREQRRRPGARNVVEEAEQIAAAAEAKAAAQRAAQQDESQPGAESEEQKRRRRRRRGRGRGGQGGGGQPGTPPPAGE